MKIPQSATFSKYTALPLFVFGSLFFGIPSPQNIEVSAQTPTERPARQEETQDNPTNEDGEIESGTETTTGTGDTPAALQSPDASQGSKPSDKSTEENLGGALEDEEGGGVGTNDDIETPKVEEEQNRSLQNPGNSNTSKVENGTDADNDAANKGTRETDEQNPANIGDGNTNQEDRSFQGATTSNSDDAHTEGIDEPEDTDGSEDYTPPTVPVVPVGSLVRPDPKDDNEDDGVEDDQRDEAEESNETQEKPAATTPPLDLYDMLENLANGLESITGGEESGEVGPEAGNNEIPESNTTDIPEESADSETQSPQEEAETAEEAEIAGAENDPVEAIGAVAAGTINPLLDLVNTTVGGDEYESHNLSFATTAIAYTAGFIFLLLGILFASLEALARRMPRRAPFFYSQIKQSFSFKLGFETDGLKQGFSSIGRLATRLFF